MREGREEKKRKRRMEKKENRLKRGKSARTNNELEMRSCLKAKERKTFLLCSLVRTPLLFGPLSPSVENYN